MICNFRAPNYEHKQLWIDFKRRVWDQGLDVCYVVLSLVEAYMKGSSQVNSISSVQNIQMNNIFVYQVPKPRREPAISVLTKINNQNIDALTHVTVDGVFVTPAINARERIEAIRNLPVW